MAFLDAHMIFFVYIKEINSLNKIKQEERTFFQILLRNDVVIVSGVRARICVNAKKKNFIFDRRLS